MGILRQGASLAHNQHTESLKTSGKLRIPPDWQSASDRTTIVETSRRQQGSAGGPATAGEIADAIVFLATDHASFIYGAKLDVDGGRIAI